MFAKCCVFLEPCNKVLCVIEILLIGEDAGLRRIAKDDVFGEHEIIDLLVSHFDAFPGAVLPFGDDVAAVPFGDRLCVLKTDMLVGKTDVPTGMSMRQAARKAVVMNISDFASKGVLPTALLVALGLPKGTIPTSVEEIAKGLNTAAREYDTYIVGGDTNEACDLIISVMAFGTCEKKDLIPRSGSKPGDIVAVTGTFGKSSTGLRLLLGEYLAPKGSRALTEAVFMPKARLKEGVALGHCGAVSASIDSSDGLAWSLHEIAKMSNVGFLINKVPVAKEALHFCKMNGLDAEELALYGGEEYELVVTVKPEMWDTALSAVEATGGCLLPIGKVTKEKGVFLQVKGEKRVIEARGWEHFKTKIF